MDDSRQLGPDASAARTVCELFDHQIRIRPDATAVRTSDCSWTYAEFGRETARLAHRLAASVLAQARSSGCQFHAVRPP